MWDLKVNEFLLFSVRSSLWLLKKKWHLSNFPPVLILMTHMAGDDTRVNNIFMGCGKRGATYMVTKYTGCFGTTAKKLELITRGRKQPITCDGCYFFHYIGTVCYLVSKRFHNYPEIIHLRRLWVCRTVETRLRSASAWEILDSVFMFSPFSEA